MANIPQTLNSYESLLYLGLNHDRSSKIWSRWCEPNKYYDEDLGTFAQDFLRNSVEYEGCDPDEDDDWTPGLRQIGADEKLIDGIVCSGSEYDDVRRSKSALEWVVQAIDWRWEHLVFVKGGAGQDSHDEVVSQGELGGADETPANGDDPSKVQADDVTSFSYDHETNTVVNAAGETRDYVPLWCATSRIAAEKMWSGPLRTGKFKLSKLMTNSPSDFSRNQAVYRWTPDLEGAQMAAEYAMKTASPAGICLVRIEMPMRLIQEAQTISLRWPDDEWRQMVYHSRRKERVPKDLMRKVAKAQMIVGDTAFGLDAKYEKMRDWREVDESCLKKLRSGKPVTQFVFGHSGDCEFEEMVEGLGDGRSLPSLVKNSKKKKSKSKANSNSFANVFEGLDLEEPAGRLQDDTKAKINPSPGTSTPATPPPVVPEFELEAQEEDQDFALWCLLEECHKIRVFVRNTWLAYVEKRLSLAVASEVTDKAFILIRLTTCVFFANFPHFWSFPHVARYLDVDLETNGGNLERFKCKGSETSATTYSGATSDTDAAELLCIPAYMTCTLVRSLWWAAEDYVRLSMLMGHAATHHPFAFSMTEFQCMTELLAPHMNAWLSTEHLDTFFADVMPSVTGSARVLPVYTVIQVQIYMDIVDTIGYSQGMEVSSLSDLRLALSEDIAYHERYAPTLLDAEARSASASVSPMRAACKRRMEKALTYTFGSTQPPSGNPRAGANLPALSPYFLRLPVTCGWLINYTEQPHYLDGIATCNNGSLMLAMAHLYTTCKEHGLVEAWPDMDLCIETQGPERMKLWSPADSVRSLEKAAQHYDMALGVKASQYATDRSKRGVDARVRLHSPLHIREKAVKFEPRSAFTRSRMSTGDGLADTLTQGDDDVTASDVFGMTSRLINRSPADLDKHMRQQWASSKTLTPEQTLSLLQSSLKAVFSIPPHVSSVRQLLEHVKEILHDTIVQLRANEGLSEDYSGYEIASDILWQAARAGKSSTRYLKQYTMLGAFAAELHSWIVGSGSDVLDHARLRIKGLHCGDRNVPRPYETMMDDTSKERKMTMKGFEFAMKTCDYTHEEKEKLISGRTMMKELLANPKLDPKDRALWDAYVQKMIHSTDSAGKSVPGSENDRADSGGHVQVDARAMVNVVGDMASAI
ncbi:hypothetical protein LTR27_008075 [Elasticomyces elasticus]|nr:hypothetical protein LTR27_008075 [Elasticomyces elasticus]